MINNFWEWLLSLFKDNIFHFGANIDDRYPDDIAKDYLHDEVAVAGSRDLYDNSMFTQVPYEFESQFQTSSCVAHGTTLSLQIAIKRATGAFIRLSKAFVYKQRANYPNKGMILVDAFDILRKQGSCLFIDLPTPQTENEINDVIITDALAVEASLETGLEYYKITDLFSNTTIDAITSVTSEGMAVNILIYASYNEWAQVYPQNNEKVDINKAAVRHCVTVIPNSSFRLNGKRYITIQDSTAFGGAYIRYLSEDFVQQRVYSAVYWKTVTLQAQSIPKPKFTFTKPLSIGSKGNDVLELQKVLVYEGILPKDCMTGYFGGRTMAGVKIFQTKYSKEILEPVVLEKPTGAVYLSTQKQLNKLYS